MSIHNSRLTIRITVLGSKKTGKTSFVRNYIGKSTNETELQLIDTAYSCDAVIEDAHVTQQILDSDGMNSAVTAWAHGIIIVYSIDNRDSFVEAEKLIQKTKQITMKNATIMLVANKIDLSSQRTISMEEGQRLAMKYNCNYKELSSQGYQGTMISSVFYELSHEIIEKRGLRGKIHRTPLMVRRVFQAIAGTAMRQKRRSYTSYL